jgi:hypothetical protein
MEMQTSRIKALSEETRDPDAAAREIAVDLVPLMEQQNKELLDRIATLRTGTKEWADANKEYWDRRSDIARIIASADKEQADQQKKMAEEAKKAAADTREMSSMYVDLIKKKLSNNPLLNDEQRNKAIMPALMEEFKLLSRATPGESPLESLKRQLEREDVVSELMKSMGFDGESLQTIGQEILQDFYPSIAKRFKKGQESLLSPGGGARAQNFMAGLDRVAQAEGARGYGGGSDWAQDAATVARNAASGQPVVFQVIAQPGQSEQELRATFEEMLHGFFGR